MKTNTKTYGVYYVTHVTPECDFYRLYTCYHEPTREEIRGIVGRFGKGYVEVERVTAKSIEPTGRRYSEEELFA